jgi:uncharacterized phage-like protein YoqJ
METASIELLVQAGAVGIALALIWVVYKLVTNHDNHLLDALERNTDAWVKNSAAISKLTEKIDR